MSSKIIDRQFYAELQPLVRLLACDRNAAERPIAAREIHVVIATDTECGVGTNGQGWVEAVVGANLEINELPTAIGNSPRARTVVQGIASGFVPGADATPWRKYGIRPRPYE